MKVSEFNAKKIYSEVSGVTALVDKNIEIKLNEYGLYEEVVNNLNENDNLNDDVEFVSGYLNHDVNEDIISEQLYAKTQGINYDKRIGYYLNNYAGHVNNTKIRANSSSGGMGTWIIEKLFEKKLIDYVIHVKENTDKGSDILFKYQISDTIEKVYEGSKTKYYPVELSEVLKIVKSKPGKYALVGIPSFINAVRLLQIKQPIFKERIVYTVGLVCGHQKSSKFAESLAWNMGIKPGNLTYINFREKLEGQPSNKYGIKVEGLKEGLFTSITKPKEQLIGQDWGMGFFKPLASDFTDDVFNETADIMIGDAWVKKYYSDSYGNSVIIVRNKELEKIIQEGISNRELNLEVVDKEFIFTSQKSHFKHTRKEMSYRLFIQKKLGFWVPTKRVTPSDNLDKDRKRVQDLRLKISQSSHLLYKAAVERDDFDYFKNQMDKLSNIYLSEYRMTK